MALSFMHLLHLSQSVERRCLVFYQKIIDAKSGSLLCEGLMRPPDCTTYLPVSILSLHFSPLSCLLCLFLPPVSRPYASRSPLIFLFSPPSVQPVALFLCGQHPAGPCSCTPPRTSLLYYPLRHHTAARPPATHTPACGCALYNHGLCAGECNHDVSVSVSAVQMGGA